MTFIAAAIMNFVAAPEKLHRTLLPGRAAAEIQSADELVVTELMFTGVFSVLTPEQIVALTSCFVWTEKSEVGVKVRRLLTPALSLCFGIADGWRKCHD